MMAVLDAGAVFSIVWLAVFLPPLVVGTVWFWLRKDLQPIKARSPKQLVFGNVVFIVFMVRCRVVNNGPMVNNRLGLGGPLHAACILEDLPVRPKPVARLPGPHRDWWVVCHYSCAPESLSLNGQETSTRFVHGCCTAPTRSPNFKYIKTTPLPMMPSSVFADTCPANSSSKGSGSVAGLGIAAS